MCSLLRRAYSRQSVLLERKDEECWLESGDSSDVEHVEGNQGIQEGDGGCDAILLACEVPCDGVRAMLPRDLPVPMNDDIAAVAADDCLNGRQEKSKSWRKEREGVVELEVK
jgi:hypothetical protein